jgi:general stress protein 26
MEDARKPSHKEPTVDQAQEKFILNLMKRHNVMTIATVRPDGFPQATTVGYANEGFDLYFSCDKSSQKAKNLRKSDKVSATIDRDMRDWNKIKGLSLAGHAEILKGRRDREHAYQVLLEKFPEMTAFPANDPAIAFVRVHPTVISVLDYSQGFGHTDLVKIPAASV